MRILGAVLELADNAGGRLLDRAADVARERIDAFAFQWLMVREGLHRGQAAELLEHLGAQLGAKIEMHEPLG